MTTDYRKYYFLEDYLFREVKNNFHKNGCLSPEEFFCIIIWKANRRKTKIREKFPREREKLEGIIKAMTGKIWNEKDENKRLGILLQEGLKYGFRLSIASAILTILYPENFTVYDYRVLGTLNKKKEDKDKIKDFTYNPNVINEYFKFRDEIKKISEEKKLTLRDTDRYLWGKSFYEDLEKLLGNYCH